MDKSVPRVAVWHHSAEPRDAKTMTLGTVLSIRTSHSCQNLILFTFRAKFHFWQIRLYPRYTAIEFALNNRRTQMKNTIELANCRRLAETLSAIT